MNMVTHIKLDTAAGPANSSTKPATVSKLPLKKREAVNRAHSGISTWVEIKNVSMRTGLRKVVLNSATRRLSAPARVIRPNRKGTNGRRCMNTPGSKKPSAIPRGVSTGISRSICLFMALAFLATIDIGFMIL